MLTIHGRNTSSNVQTVMWTVAELGLEHRRLDVGGAFGGTDTADYRAMHPMGLVPVLEDGGTTVFESAAIVRYLAARYGSEAFWPADPATRAPLDAWAEWCRAHLLPTLTTKIFWQLVRTPPAKRDPAVLADGVATLGRLMPLVEARLGEAPYLGGASLSFADIFLGGGLYRYYTLEFERADLPRLRAYYDRLTERPAYHAHVMISYESLRAA
ncbi:MAG: glutathione S-transferase family protein [Paracoccaceae bacterium]